MKSYIEKPSYINKSDFEKKNWSLSPINYSLTNIKNKNIVLLKNLQHEASNLGKNILRTHCNSNYKLIKISSLNNFNYLVDSKEVNNCIINTSYLKSTEYLLFATRGSIENISYLKLLQQNNIFYTCSNNIYYYNLSTDKKYYILGVLKSFFIKKYIRSISCGGTIKEFLPKAILNIPIPFPTQNNNKNPQAVEELVSLITQNIIDKEEQIKLKNEKINTLIEEELYNNQKVNKFKYTFPTINEILNEGRLDTGVYGEQYKKIEFLIENYKGGVFKFERDKIKTGKTPKDYFYSNDKKYNNYLWLTPKSIKNNLILSLQYLYTKQETNLINEDIIFTGIGTNCQGNCIIYIEKILGKTYINQNCYLLRLKTKLIFKIYLVIFLNSKIFKTILQKYTSKGSIPAIYSNDLIKLKIPLFPESKQQEMAKEYYNIIDKNKHLNLKNYLELEKERNLQLGIFQLNIELFELKEQLENLIDKIINEENIEIVVEY